MLLPAWVQQEIELDPAFLTLNALVFEEGAFSKAFSRPPS